MFLDLAFHFEVARRGGEEFAEPGLGRGIQQWFLRRRKGERTGCYRTNHSVAVCTCTSNWL
jgi:hypothetical protein